MTYKIDKILPSVPNDSAWQAANRALDVRDDMGLEMYRLIEERAGNGVWTEIEEDAYDEALGCLPPRYVEGGFCVTEAATSRSNGDDILLTIIHHNGQRIAAYLPWKEAQ